MIAWHGGVHLEGPVVQMTGKANKVGRVAPRAPMRREQVRRGASCRACSWSEDSASPMHGARGAASPYPSGFGQHLFDASNGGRVKMRLARHQIELDPPRLSSIFCTH